MSTTVEDDGMQLCGVIESEEELQEWLESLFEDSGWTAIREVSPHGADCRADLIVGHDEYGWFGIETKYFRNDGGAKAADAHHQITQKYRGKKYIGRRINCWVVCPYFYCYNTDDYDMKQQQQKMRAEFVRELFCRHGIGYVNLDRWQLLLDFAYSQKYAKVPVGGEYLSEYIENVDVERIRSRVDEKRQRYSYD